MWISTYHRFLNRAAFLAACKDAGWTCPPGRDPEVPHAVAMDIVGTFLGPPKVDTDGMPIAGEEIDPRYHVNVAWHAQEMHPAFAESLIVPATPSRTFGLPLASPTAPPVPASILAWKGKAALREAGLLDAVETAVAAAGGRVLDAWTGASEWSRNSDFLLSLAKVVGLTTHQIDDLFRATDAMKS